MVLIGLFLVVLAGAFLSQSFGIGGDRVFEFVWPVLVALIGLGFIAEARKEKKCPVCEHAKHAVDKRPQDNKTKPAAEQSGSRDAGFRPSM